MDDELPGLAYLKMLCQQIEQLEIVKTFDNPEKLLAEISSLDFDLVISDIEMPGIDGITIGQALRDKLVIFTTAYKEYAVDAFDLNAVDYLTKPIKVERLRQAVDKALDRLKPGAKKFAAFNTDKGKSLLYFDAVALITTAVSDSRDKEVLLTDGSSVLLKNISFAQLLDELPDAAFCRVNKKEVVALLAVRFFAHNEITLHQAGKNGKPVVVSLNEKYRPDFLEKVKI